MQDVIVCVTRQYFKQWLILLEIIFYMIIYLYFRLSIIYISIIYEF